MAAGGFLSRRTRRMPCGAPSGLETDDGHFDVADGPLPRDLRSAPRADERSTQRRRPRDQSCRWIRLIFPDDREYHMLYAVVDRHRRAEPDFVVGLRLYENRRAYPVLQIADVASD